MLLGLNKMTGLADLSRMKVFKAPHHKMFKIESVLFVILTTNASSLIGVWARNLDFATSVPSIDSLICGRDGDTEGTFQVTGLDELTKYFTIGKDITGNFEAYVFVYGDIVNATKTQLILDWIGRRR